MLIWSLLMTDRCIVCKVKIAEHLTVCSPKCSGSLGGRKKVPKGYAVTGQLKKKELKK